MDEKKTNVKSKLYDLLNIVSWSEFSRTYFGKSNSWLYHKLNGIDGNGKPTDFTDKEMEILKESLKDLAKRIEKASESL